MIKLELDIPMPKACIDCPLQDEEFHYCHGRLCSAAWECENYEEARPKWCPLIEVKEEKEKLEYNMVNNRLNSKEISDFSPTGAKVY